MSANNMFYRNKQKTVNYRHFQQEVSDVIGEDKWEHGDSEVMIVLEVGLSSKRADLDNTIKPLLDTLQYVFDGFDDNKVFRIEADKKLVEKGKEYLDVSILQNKLS